MIYSKYHRSNQVKRNNDTEQEMGFNRESKNPFGLLNAIQVNLLQACNKTDVEP